MLKKLLNLFSTKPNKSTHKKSTKSKSNSTNQREKIKSTRIGELGEYKINIQLDQLPKDCKYLSDIMIENAKSKTGYSQIDHIVISPYAIFVVETKNYNGKIRGTREDRQWTVNGRFKMMNPIKQNYGHMKALESILPKGNSFDYISMISFTMRCRFNIDPDLRKINSNVLVVYDTELSEYINRKILRLKTVHGRPLLSESEIENIYTIIEKANINDPLIREKHVEAINKKPGKIIDNVCPQCGGEITIKKGRYGSFKGCSNYPACRFTAKV